VKDRKLPAYCYPDRPLEAVDGAVIHYFSGKNVDRPMQYELGVCRNLFLDLNRARAEREFYMREDNWPEGRMYASAHILIGREGEVWKLVELDNQAWHAGASIMNGRGNCNRWTLGLELIGTNNSGFSQEQYEALAQLLAALMEEHGFPRVNIQGHDTVRHKAIEAGSDKKPKYDPSGRKDGEGDNFDWNYLWQLVDEPEQNRLFQNPSLPRAEILHPDAVQKKGASPEAPNEA